nr:RNA directed DNA polymerase (reverse transcriptase) [Hymenolepis microstoma]
MIVIVGPLVDFGLHRGEVYQSHKKSRGGTEEGVTDVKETDTKVEKKVRVLWDTSSNAPWLEDTYHCGDTRWPIAVPLRDTSSASVAKALIKSWISIFGVPSVITTDRGSQFTSTLFRELNQLLGTTHIRTTAYHPEANGLVERFHRQHKSAIIATSSSLNWVERLPIILLALRSTVKEDLGCCPAELVLGTPLRLPGEMIFESQDRGSVDPSSYATRLKEHFRSVLPTPTRQDSKPAYIHKDLSTSSFVFPPYDGPYKVLQRNPKYFILDRNGTKDSVRIGRLKPAYLEPPPTPAPEVGAHLPRPPTQTTEATIPTPSPPPLPPLPNDVPTPSVSTPVPLHHEPYYTRSGRRVTFPSRLADYVHSLSFERFLPPIR